MAGPNYTKMFIIGRLLPSKHKTFCITFVQRRPNIVEMLYNYFVFAG